MSPEERLGPGGLPWSDLSKGLMVMAGESNRARWHFGARMIAGAAILAAVFTVGGTDPSLWPRRRPDRLQVGAACLSPDGAAGKPC